MPDTIATLARRLARLDRRVTALERARRQPYPPWRDLPLTGNTTLADPDQPPQVRANPWDTLEFSGRIGIADARATSGAVIALLPEGYWPGVARTVPVASDATRTDLHLEITPKGRVLLRLRNGDSVRASWISFDGASCRLDAMGDRN